MNKKMKIVGGVVLLGVLYYGLQLASTAVHYNCAIAKDDCPPPIYGSAEIIYRSLVQPPWLDKFEIRPTIFSFTDGDFTFWQGRVDGEIEVIRVPVTGSPVMQWLEKYPTGIEIEPADGKNIQGWLKNHPDTKLSQ